RSILKVSSFGRCLPYLPQSDVAELGDKGVFINAIYSGFIPPKLKDNELYKSLIVALNYSNKAAVEEFKDKTQVVEQLIQQKI
ncbi:hypothetical protein, partial [Burkholderia sp. SIMBA_051]